MILRFSANILGQSLITFAPILSGPHSCISIPCKIPMCCRNGQHNSASRLQIWFVDECYHTLFYISIIQDSICQECSDHSVWVTTSICTYINFTCFIERKCFSHWLHNWCSVRNLLLIIYKIGSSGRNFDELWIARRGISKYCLRNDGRFVAASKGYLTQCWSWSNGPFARKFINIRTKWMVSLIISRGIQLIIPYRLSILRLYVISNWNSKYLLENLTKFNQTQNTCETGQNLERRP